MADFITMSVLGRARTALRLRQRLEATRREIRTSMTSSMGKLASYVQLKKLSGQVLRNRTGTLRRSIHPAVSETADEIIGKVGTRVHYARIHEFGGTVQRKAHQRMMTMAWGRPVKNPRKIDVRAHPATFPERAFLRPSLAEQKQHIIAGLHQAVRRGMR